MEGFHHHEYDADLPGPIRLNEMWPSCRKIDWFNESDHTGITFELDISNRIGTNSPSKHRYFPNCILKCNPEREIQGHINPITKSDAIPAARNSPWDWTVKPQSKAETKARMRNPKRELVVFRILALTLGNRSKDKTRFPVVPTPIPANCNIQAKLFPFPI